MKKLSVLLSVAAILSIGFVPQSIAGEAEVKWDNPESFKDIRPSNQHKAHYRKSILDGLDKHVQKLAKDLPEDITVQINFTDIDLAGDVQYDFKMSSDVRVVKHQYWPMLSFDLVVKKADNVIIKEPVVLKDVSFISRGTSLRYRNDALRYEKTMLKDWFNRDLSEKITLLNEKRDDVMAAP